MRIWRAGAVLVAGACLVTLAGSPASSTPEELARAAPAAAAGGPYVTFLFSRTEMTAADGCVVANGAVAGLDTVVAPYLAALGYSGVGTLVTDRTRASTRTCTHSQASMTASWADATALATTYGWSFVSHTATYPGSLATLTPARAEAETCGSALTLEAHGLPGARGMIAYPGAQPLPTALQRDYSSRCFAWGRRYEKSATTTAAAASTPPYWQNTKGMNGGPCNRVGQACYTIVATGSKRYDLPSTLVSRVRSLAPGQWLSVQAYILVTGRSPAYSTSPIRWDCRSSDPRLHWSNDNERYCYSDWQRIVAAVQARPDIVVTDPLTVGIAFGRPAAY